MKAISCRLRDDEGGHQAEIFLDQDDESSMRNRGRTGD